MKTSIEITLMPLNNDYQEIIKEFIVSLRNEDFKIIENPLSTQIYGDFDKMMNSLIFRIKKYFSIHEGIIINLKIVNGDRSNYKPNF
tara:strand:+ start:726 stop:986 length:261 start_codon:yes stop_codon:yes gene_type:complete